MSIERHLPSLSELAARLNRETPYRCTCREGGAEIQVADTTIWFEESEAREILSAVLFVNPGPRLAPATQQVRSRSILFSQSR